MTDSKLQMSQADPMLHKKIGFPTSEITHATSDDAVKREKGQLKLLGRELQNKHEIYTFFPPITSGPSCPLALYLQNKYPTQKLMETDLHFAHLFWYKYQILWSFMESLWFLSSCQRTDIPPIGVHGLSCEISRCHEKKDLGFTADV